MSSSRKYRGQRIVVWPPFLDSNVSRSGGRRVPLEKAVPHPSVREIEEAARNLGLDPLVEEKAYPRNWAHYPKRVAVIRKGGRQETLVSLAEEIRRIRSRRERS